MHTDIVTRIIEFEDELEGKKVILFGTGEMAKATYLSLRSLSFRVSYCIDNNSAAWEHLFYRLTILSPDSLYYEDKSKIAIVIASMYFEEISSQLDRMGFIQELHYFSILKQPDSTQSNVVADQNARETRMINGVEVGKYTYGAVAHCKEGGRLKKVGAFCSINHTAQIAVHNHPLHLISTHPFLVSGISTSGDKVPVGLLAENNKERYVISERDHDGKTIIGNDVWIGAGAIVLSNVTIGNGAIIGAGAVVTNDVPDYAVVVGAPARVIRYRFNKEEIKILNAVEWWNWSDEDIVQNSHLFLKPELFFEEMKKSQI